MMVMKVQVTVKFCSNFIAHGMVKLWYLDTIIFYLKGSKEQQQSHYFVLPQTKSDNQN